VELFYYLANDPVLLLLWVGMIGLIIGSFLNVVIYRLPRMMEREWYHQCAELLDNKKPEIEKITGSFNLVYPRSRCPYCGHLITAFENIPLLSYLWQRGRCTACAHTISPRYPLIEAGSALLAVVTAWQFGWGWPLLGALALTWALLTLSLIDIDHLILPDDITLPFLWLGIACNLGGFYTDLQSSVLGAIGGYLSLWSVYWLFKGITGKEGMGFGDFKLLAMLGAWLGWQALPFIILTSSCLGLGVNLTLMVTKGRDRHIPFSFGPYLAGAGWISLLWGKQLTQFYFSWFVS
jgi:leader peptidase (prepilin peptidase)/N-methyltransferase